ncbi:hypothetical protein VCRA2120E57_530019 [Vibrio crassostreae]|nr:hypothetical protein VCRA2120E57_530019 [Vibrio crassostreae]
MLSKLFNSKDSQNQSLHQLLINFCNKKIKGAVYRHLMLSFPKIMTQLLQNPSDIQIKSRLDKCNQM